MLCTLVCATALTQGKSFNSLPILKVEGNKIVSSKRTPVLLRGVNAASLEWDTNGEGHIMESVRVAIQEWKSNIVRIPLSQDRWFGKEPGTRDSGKAYQNLVKKIVSSANTYGAYIMLDLHWNNAGVWGQNIGQHKMPDVHTLDFWVDCAAQFANKPGVLFDLYNETHDITWTVWKKGGSVTETSAQGASQGPFIPSTYQTPGMQAILNAVRSTGAKNLVVAGGLDWAYDLSGFLNGFQLSDPNGNGVVYACHAYPFKGDTVAQWLTKLDAALPVIPVFVGEFGDQPNQSTPSTWVTQVLAAMQTRGVHWAAWDFHPAASPCLISNWNYTPTASFGVPVKNALASTPQP